MKKLLLSLALTAATPAHASLTQAVNNPRPQPDISRCMQVQQQVRAEYFTLRNEVAAGMYLDPLVGAIYGPEIFFVKHPVDIPDYLDRAGLHAEATDFKIKSAQLEAYAQRNCPRS